MRALTDTAVNIVGCNGAKTGNREKTGNRIELEYRDNPTRNVDLRFISAFNFESISCRLRDLAELAAYVYAADIKTSNQTGPRAFHFFMNLRDIDFWKQAEIKTLLNEMLCYLTGDREFRFHFGMMKRNKKAVHKEAGTNRNKRDNGSPFPFMSKRGSPAVDITFLSGGVDSASGAIDRIETGRGKVLLISHQSDPPGIYTAQNELFNEISRLYPGRCGHFKFHCGLQGDNSPDTSRSTSAFLYNSIAFILSNLAGRDCYYVYKNGISAINFRGINTFNNPTGRTVHPKTLHLFEKLFSLILGREFRIIQPFLFKTEAGVIDVLKKYKRIDLLKRTISCRCTGELPSPYSNCGYCPDCISKIFALYAAGMNETARQNYYLDFPAEQTLNEKLYYLLQSILKETMFFRGLSINTFSKRWKNELREIDENYRCDCYGDNVENIFLLCRQHYLDTRRAIQEMRDEYDSPWAVYESGEFFKLLDRSRKEWLSIKSAMVSEPAEGYGADYDYPYTEAVKKQVPPRRLIELVFEKCKELIKNGVIVKPIKETKKNRVLSSMIISELGKEYNLTAANKATIHEYFKKGVLMILFRKGSLTVEKIKIHTL